MSNRTNGKPSRAPSQPGWTPSLAPTGFHNTWRGLRTVLSLAYAADPRLFARLFAVEVGYGLSGLFATYCVKLLTDAAVAASAGGVLFAAAGFALANLLERLCGRHYVFSTIQLGEKAQILIDQRLMQLAGAVPGIEHHERPDYVDELTLLRNGRGDLGQIANATVLNMRVAIQFVGQAAILASLHPALLLLPVFGLPPLLLSRRAGTIMERFNESVTDRRRTVRHLYECATRADAGKELRVFGLAGELLARHWRLSDDLIHAQERVEWQGVVIAGVGGRAFFAAGYVAAIGLVLWRAVHGLATAGDVALAATIAAGVNGNVAEAVSMSAYLQRVLRHTRRYLWLLDYAESAWRRLREATPSTPVSVPAHLTHGITLHNVSFTYPGTDTEVLRDVSLHLPAGKVVALVGENGAGKTTLVKLLGRFYEPTAGQVLVDGVDLRHLDVGEWRTRVSAAFQDFRRFEFLARETVGIGDLPFIDSPPHVVGALARAGGEAVLTSLPQHLETQLGKDWPNGVELSGGQWQRLALGRAFMRQDPLLVIFDEPTAAIDAPTEHALFERFAAATRTGSSRGTVTLIVSHRFSTVRMADLIVVLADGTIAEQGTHDDLMRHHGLYAELYTLQAAAYR